MKIVQQVTIAEVELPGGERVLKVDAGTVKKASELIRLLGEAMKVVAQHVAGKHEQPAVAVYGELPANGLPDKGM